VSRSALTEQLQRLNQRFAQPSSEAADVQNLKDESTAFHGAAMEAVRAGRAASAAERAALLR